MVIEDFGLELVYIPGPNNVVADTLSRLNIEDKNNNNNKEEHINDSFEQKSMELADLFAGKPLSKDTYPLSFKLIQKEQKADTKLIDHAAKTKGYAIHDFHGAGNTRQLICKNGKIVIPPSLQSRIIDWYHTVLCHPGHTRMEETIWQHFYWISMRDKIRKAVR